MRQNSKPLKIFHLANINSTNVGNGALMFGAENVIREDFKKEIVFHHEPWDEYIFNRKSFDIDFVERVNRESDALLICGVIAINTRPYLNHTGMNFNLPLELWGKLKVPIVFYGISYRIWPWQYIHHKEKIYNTIKHAIENKNVLFGVRDDGTKEWIEENIGIKSDKILKVPDPALFIKTEPYEHKQIEKGRVNVILSLNNEDEWNRYGGTLQKILMRLSSKIIQERSFLAFWNGIFPNITKRKRKMLANIANAMEDLNKKYNVNIILCPHYFHDFKIMAEFVEFLPVSMPHQNVLSTGIYRVSNSMSFYDIYAKADVSISMRVHSMSPSIAVETPVIVLSTQKRLSRFMSEFKLEEFCLDAFDANLASKIKERFEYCISHREEVLQKLRKAKRKAREDIREYNIKFIELLKNSGADV